MEIIEFETEDVIISSITAKDPTELPIVTTLPDMLLTHDYTDDDPDT